MLDVVKVLLRERIAWYPELDPTVDLFKLQAHERQNNSSAMEVKRLKRMRAGNYNKT